jgi:hypothetical protein
VVTDFFLDRFTQAEVFIAVMEKPRPAKPSDPAHLTLEAWSQGMMVGTLVFMIMLTIANMRRKVLLHKLILIEVRCPDRLADLILADT